MKKATIVIVIIILIFLGYWIFVADKDGAGSIEQMEEVGEVPGPEDDSAASMEAELEGLNQTDLETEFQDYDQDASQL
ncbi:MAG: hypothetical protein R3B52_00700 [Candidatus Paceibacterota bacterium]